MIRVFLLLILALALATRVVKVGSNPPGFFADEAIRGLDAYYLLTRGTDSYGEKFPVFFRVFGEYTPPLQTYLEVPFVAIFGLNETGVRLAAVILGVIVVFLTYLVAKTLFSRLVGLVAAGVIAIFPWAIHYSRTGFEYNVYLVMFLGSILTWLLAKKKHYFLPLSLLFWGLTLYTYNPAKLIVPTFLLALLIFDWPKIKKGWRWLVVGLVILVLISLPIVNHIVAGEGLIRFNQVSILSQQSRPQEIIKEAARNYVAHFSLDFLFFKGDPSPPNNRHFSLGLKPLLISVLPLLLLGLGRLVFLKDKKTVLTWLLVYPLSGVLTLLISTNRAMVGLPLIAILIGLGVESLVELRKGWSKVVLVFLTLIVTFDFGMFVFFYFEKYPKLTADFWGWQMGPKEIMAYFLENLENYDDLYMSGEFNEGWVFLRFYDPERICKDKCKIGDFWRGREIVDPNRKQLFSLSPEYLKNSEYEEKFLIKKTVRYPDGKTAFLIGEVVDLK